MPKGKSAWDEIVEWARTYSVGLWAMINEYSRRLFAEALSDFMFRPGATMGDLRAATAHIFGPERAGSIARTELTRAYYIGGKMAADEIRASGIRMIGIWHTKNDELVCEICGPLNLRPESPEGGWVPEGMTGPGATPPAHVNCRCGVGYEIA